MYNIHKHIHTQVHINTTRHKQIQTLTQMRATTNTQTHTQTHPPTHTHTRENVVLVDGNFIQKSTQAHAAVASVLRSACAGRVATEYM